MSVQDFLKACVNFLGKPLSDVLKSFVVQNDIKPICSSPKAYRYLNKLKLKTMLEEMDLKSRLFFDTGCDEIIGFEYTEKANKTNFSYKNVLVIMVRRLYSPW